MSAPANETIDITFGTTFEVNGGSAFPFDTKGPFEYILLRSGNNVHRVYLETIEGTTFIKPAQSPE